MVPSPQLTLFCELDPQPLIDLFQQPGLISTLKSISASVSLGLMDESAERAEAAAQLNREGIPVTAWLLLPKDQGYWFNLDNAALAAARYARFKVWSERNGLRWAAVGLDIEPDLRLMRAAVGSKLRTAGTIFTTLFDRVRFQRGAGIYHELVRQIRADGFAVESYQFCLIADEREAGSKLVQRLSGVVDLDVDREVLMLYSSFFPGVGAGLLAEYGPLAGGIGLGSTGGGVTVEGLVSTRALTWPELERDLLIAGQTGRPLYLFSLEGCVQQGFLEKIAAFDWQRSAPLLDGQIRKVKKYRRLLRGVLRLSRLLVR